MLEVNRPPSSSSPQPGARCKHPSQQQRNGIHQHPINRASSDIHKQAAELVYKAIAKARVLEFFVPDPRPCIQFERSHLKGRVGVEVLMSLVMTEVESSTAQPLQDVEPLERATAPQVGKRSK